LCDGDDLPVRLASLWLFRFACRYDFCLTARQEELRCLGQIFNEMESIGALKRLGSALRCRFCILTPTITAHHRNLKTLPHPLG
jgi:hypothetical protein